MLKYLLPDSPNTYRIAVSDDGTLTGPVINEDEDLAVEYTPFARGNMIALNGSFSTVVLEALLAHMKQWSAS